MSRRVSWVAPSAAGVRLLVQRANAAERLEAVRRRRAELARLTRTVDEMRRADRMLRLTLDGERALHKAETKRQKDELAERDERIAWLEARLAEQSRRARPC